MPLSGLCIVRVMQTVRLPQRAVKNAIVRVMHCVSWSDDNDIMQSVKGISPGELVLVHLLLSSFNVMHNSCMTP
ncbi:Titin [Dirofilaria immitis]